MSVKIFELFHGAALAKIMRRGKKVSLLMTETRPSDVWAAYTLNDAVILYIKVSTNAKERKRKKGSFSWQFNFTPSELEQLSSIQGAKPIYTALVCGSRSVGKNPMEVCFLKPEQSDQCIDIKPKARTQSIHVERDPGMSLRAYGTKNGHDHPLIIHRDALEKWEVPGS